MKNYINQIKIVEGVQYTIHNFEYFGIVKTSFENYQSFQKKQISLKKEFISFHEMQKSAANWTAYDFETLNSRFN